MGGPLGRRRRLFLSNSCYFLLVTTTTWTNGFTIQEFANKVRRIDGSHNSNQMFIKVPQKPVTTKLFHSPSSMISAESAQYVSENANVNHLSIIDAVTQNPQFWSICIMLSIIGLLYTWEETVKLAREKLPSTLTPVVDSMLGEMGGLGFIGLFLSVFVTDGLLGKAVGKVSEHYLGEEEILLESFEFLHTAFFEVGIGFFVIAGLTVTRVLEKIESLKEVSRAIFDAKADGEMCLQDLSKVLQVENVAVDMKNECMESDEEIVQLLRSTPKKSAWSSMAMSTEKIRAEALVVRERFIQEGLATPTLRIEKYFERIFGKNLQEIVELSPLVWLPLVIPISLGRKIDLSREIVSASSNGASISSGYFLGTPEFFITTSIIVVLTLSWGLWNFWKLSSMKEMLLPTVVLDSSSSSRSGGGALLLPPRYQDDKLLEEYNPSPSIIAFLESFFAEPPRNRQDKLFGVAGEAGPEIYLNSIKLHTWVVVSQIVFWGGQIVFRDIEALIQHSAVGIPELVLPETLIFGSYVLVAIGQLWLFPQTFLNYSLVTSIESLTEDAILAEASQVVENDT